MEINLRYIDNERILVRKIKGKVTFMDIFNSWQHLVSDGWLNPSIIGIINDFRDMELEANVSDVKEVVKLIEVNFDLFRGLRIAVVVDSYKNIVFPMMLEELSKKVEIKPFSTFEAAQDWVSGSIY